MIFLGFDFLSLEIGFQIKNENVFKNKLNCGISDQTIIRDPN
jgi:hypothetical protein